MMGRLLPAGGGSGSPLTRDEVVKAAQAKAHRDASVQILRDAVSSLVKQAEGELGASLRSTLGSQHGPGLARLQADEVGDTEVSHGTSPGSPGRLEPADQGDWTPAEANRTSIGLHEEPEKLSGDYTENLSDDYTEKMSAVLHRLSDGRLGHMSELEKQAFIRGLLSAGRGMAGRMAAKGGVTGRVGRFLQRDVRSPITAARTSQGSVNVGVRSPLAPAAKPPPIPKDAGPYRTAQTPARASAAKPQTRTKVQDMTRHAKVVGGPGFKPKGLVRSLLPGALMLGAGYGLYKGVPAAVNWADQAANAPMAYNFGHQQYQYGYTPQGQAQF